MMELSRVLKMSQEDEEFQFNSLAEYVRSIKRGCEELNVKFKFDSINETLTLTDRQENVKEDSFHNSTIDENSMTKEDESSFDWLLRWANSEVNCNPTSEEQFMMKKLEEAKENIKELEKFMEGRNMKFVQENGQRRYGPPLNYDGPMPPKGSEIFVGKLPRECNEKDIVPLFEKIGEIFEMRLMLDFSGTNRGYCFIMFYNGNDAKRAIKELNNFEIRPGRKLGVVKSVDNCRLFIGGIPKDKTEEEIFKAIQFVMDDVVRVIAYPSPSDKSKNRGFAFVEFTNHKAAAMARRKLIPGRITIFGPENEIAVDWAEPELDVDSTIMEKVQNLYVRNLMLSTTEETLADIFNAKSDNGVEKVKKINDYAFIHFKTREQAEKAKDELDGENLEGSEIVITWAKPVDRITYKQRKALSKQLYTYPVPNVKDNQLRTSQRVFGAYHANSSYVNSYNNGNGAHGGHFNQQEHYDQRPYNRNMGQENLLALQSKNYNTPSSNENKDYDENLAVARPYQYQPPQVHTSNSEIQDHHQHSAYQMINRQQFGYNQNKVTTQQYNLFPGYVSNAFLANPPRQVVPRFPARTAAGVQNIRYPNIQAMQSGFGHYIHEPYIQQTNQGVYPPKNIIYYTFPTQQYLYNYGTHPVTIPHIYQNNGQVYQHQQQN